jgi:transcriptional regulator with XRE-family HTH domain
MAIFHNATTLHNNSYVKLQNERNKVSPSVDVAKKIADTLEVSLDYLAGEGSKIGFDKQTLKLIDEIKELEPSIKDKLLFLANAIIRDAKTGKAYAG